MSAFALPIFTYKSDKLENLSDFISESMTVRLKSKRMDLEDDQSCVFSKPKTVQVLAKLTQIHSRT